MSEMKKEVVRALNALTNNQGRIDAEDVVAAARDPSNPLHSRFDWDDANAAHQQRLHIARQIISSYYIHVRVSKTTRLVKGAPIRIKKHVKDPGVKKGYASTKSLKEDRQMAVASLQISLKPALTILTNQYSHAEYWGIPQASLLKSAIDVVQEFLSVLDKPNVVPLQKKGGQRRKPPREAA